MENIIKILKENTLNLFSDQWYEETTKRILDVKTNTILKSFYIDDINCKDFFNYVDSLTSNKKYAKRFFYENIIALNNTYKNITPKKCNLILKKYCGIKNYKYFEYNTNGVRGFILEKNII